MSKKIKCPKCDGGFLPTLDAIALGKASCPACGAEIPITPAQASEILAEANLARGRFATGAPVILEAGATRGDEFDIQWMPPGAQCPVVHVAGEPKELKFTVKPQHAQAFDGMLQRLRSIAAAGNGDLPLIDFDHSDGAASGRPTQMYWGGEDPKRGGIRLKGKWTASGKAAVTGEAPEFSRFSPEWYFDDNDEPLAIGVNLGGLVNRAAFKTIASVTAGAATQKTKTNMTKEEMQLVVTEALKPIAAEVAALKAQAKGTETDPTKTGLDETTLQKAIAKALDPFTQKLTDIETTGTKAQAKAAVAKFITAPGNTMGVIAPADTKAIEFWEAAYLADAKSAEEQLTKFGARTPTKIIVGAGAGGTGTQVAAEFSEAENRAIAGAKQLREKNKALASDAQAMEAYLRTPEGNAVYAEILASRDGKRNDVKIAR